MNRIYEILIDISELDNDWDVETSNYFYELLLKFGLDIIHDSKLQKEILEECGRSL